MYSVDITFQPEHRNSFKYILDKHTFKIFYSLENWRVENHAVFLMFKSYTNSFTSRRSLSVCHWWYPGSFIV